MSKRVSSQINASGRNEMKATSLSPLSSLPLKRPSSSHTKSVQLPLPTPDHCADRGRSCGAASTCVRNARAMEDWRRGHASEGRGLILPLPFPSPSPLIGTYRIYNKSVSTRPIDLFPKRRSAVRPLPPLPARPATPYPHCTHSQ